MQKIQQDAQFLKPFIVEPDLLEPELMTSGTGSQSSDLLKRLYHILQKIKHSPETLTESDLRSVVEEKGSQIGRPEQHLSHITHTAFSLKSLVEQLHNKGLGELLPTSQEAFGLGITHDLSAIFARYGEGKLDGSVVKFSQEDHQLTQYVVATVLGIPNLKETSIHSSYFEVAEMIHQGKGFPNIGLYVHWTEAFNDPSNRFFFQNIKTDFNGFIGDDDELTLLKALTVADYCERGKKTFGLETLSSDFEIRSADIIYRYVCKPLDEKKPLIAFGVSLVYEGGAERIRRYKNFIQNLMQKK